MKNFWLDRFRIGKTVRYKGADMELSGKIGTIVSVSSLNHSWWIEVKFEFTTSHSAYTRVISVEKDNLEIV